MERRGYKSKEKIIEYKEYEIALGKYKANVCDNCNETFFEQETVRILPKSKNQLLIEIPH